MKKIILVVFLSFLNLNLYTKEEHINAYRVNKRNFLYSLKEYSAYIAAAPTLLYHHQNIMETVKSHPYISSICFYFLINYGCDFFLGYKKQQEVYQLINKIKHVCFYLVIIHAIKNYIHQRNVCLYVNFSEKQFIDNITKDLGYSLDEITSISLHLYQELKNYLQSLNTNFNIASEEFIFLHYASLINLETVAYLTENNNNLYNMVNKCKEDPMLNIMPLTEYIKTKTKESFIDFEQNLLKSNIRLSTAL